MDLQREARSLGELARGCGAKAARLPPAGARAGARALERPTAPHSKPRSPLARPGSRTRAERDIGPRWSDSGNYSAKKRWPLH